MRTGRSEFADLIYYPLRIYQALVQKRLDLKNLNFEAELSTV